jgi:hypothetical protein
MQTSKNNMFTSKTVLRGQKTPILNRETVDLL